MSASSGIRRWYELLAVAVACSLGLAALMVAPALYGSLPRTIRDNPVESGFAAVGVVLLGTRALLRSRSWANPHANRARWCFDRLDDAARWALARGLGFALGALVVLMLLCWVPHYLTWPWCRDEDTFASLAQWWNAGIRPYRDIRAYNFPGHIYLHWLIGVVAGWGRPRVFYALDAAAVVALGLALVAWSRRRLGGTLPGLAAYFAFVGTYCGFHFEQVAERDWHAALCAALAVMILECSSGRRGLWLAAALQAVALTIRPHAILFLPAMLWALRGRPRPWRSLAEWAGALGLFTALGFLPLIAQGILDDLVRGLRVATYGGPYSRATPGAAFELLVDQLRQPWIYLQLGCLAALSWRGGGLRRPAQVWLVALVTAILYRVVAPTQHRYLELPLALFGSITIAFPVALAVAATRLPALARVVVILWVLAEAVPGRPLFFAPAASLASLGPLLRGVEAPAAPPGAALKWFRLNECPYEWWDYCAALEYLRHETGPKTQIANVLKKYPFPPFNGPVGRLSPFHAESGICWMWLIDLDLDAEFAEALENTPDSVVVWSRDEIGAEPRLRLERLTDVILRRYRPAARFGPIEVWTRKPADTAGAESGGPDASRSFTHLQR